MLSKADAKWMAAALDFEGHIGLYKGKSQTAKRGFTWIPRITVNNIHRGILQHLLDLVQVGTISNGRLYANRHYPIYEWKAYTSGIRLVLPSVIPFLIIKKEKAELLLGATIILGGKWAFSDNSLAIRDAQLEIIFNKLRNIPKC